MFIHFCFIAVFFLKMFAGNLTAKLSFERNL